MKKFYDNNTRQIVIIFLVSIFLLGAKAMSTSENEKKVIDFAKTENADEWFVINDGVMGGISKSSFVVTDKGTAVFSGSVSLENSGGFASTSKKPANYNLEGFDGVRMKVKGDGKKYMLTLKNETSFNGFSYRFEFSTKNGEWITIDAPFPSFVSKLMGQSVAAPPIDKSTIKTFGFLIADKQAGPFRLEVDWIGAFRNE